MPTRVATPSNIRPGTNQPAFEMEPVPVEQDLDRQNTFAHVADPRYWDLDPLQYDGLAPAAIQAASAGALRRSLVGLSPSTGRRFIGGYVEDPEHDRRLKYVTLTPVEFSPVRGSIVRLGETAAARVLASRPGRTDFENDTAAAQRAGVHAVEKCKAKIETVIDGVFAPRAERLARQIEAAKHPGLQRRKEVDVRQDVSAILDGDIEDMLQALGLVRGWNRDKAALAKKSLYYRLFFDRQRNRHIGNWRETLDLALGWNAAKTALYRYKSAEADTYIKANAPPSPSES